MSLRRFGWPSEPDPDPVAGAAADSRAAAASAPPPVELEPDEPPAVEPDDEARTYAEKAAARYAEQYPAGEEVDGEPVPARQPQKPEIVPHPVTGELIEIVRATPTNTLAELRAAIVDHERSVIKHYKRIIDEEIRGRLDVENVRSATVGPTKGTRWKVSVPAPTTTEWDGEKAYTVVRDLVRRGLISATAAGRCVERVVDFKPKHAELTKLANHAVAEVAEAVRECRTIVPVEDRRVTVSPVRTGRSERDDA